MNLPLYRHSRGSLGSRWKAPLLVGHPLLTDHMALDGWPPQVSSKGQWGPTGSEQCCPQVPVSGLSSLHRTLSEQYFFVQCEACQYFKDLLSSRTACNWRQCHQRNSHFCSLGTEASRLELQRTTYNLVAQGCSMHAKKKQNGNAHINASKLPSNHSTPSLLITN